MYSIKNKRILLVGASGVLGSKYADSLHKNGAKLIMSDINNKRFRREKDFKFEKRKPKQTD